MRPWSLGLTIAAFAFVPASAQEKGAEEASADIADPEAEPAGVEESVSLPVIDVQQPSGTVIDVPAACRDGVVVASVERTGPRYGPVVPADVKPKAEVNPCLAPEFRPRAESEVLYEQQRVFERDPDDDANRDTPDPCVWRTDGTDCSVSVNVSRGSAESNRRNPFD